MNYHELECTVYRLIREGKLDEALNMVIDALPVYDGADKWDVLHLYVNVQKIMGLRNAMSCLATIDEIVAAPDARPLTKLKTHLLGGGFANQREDAERWSRHVTELRPLVDALPLWRARLTLSEGGYERRFGSSRKAYDILTWGAAWLEHNVGPHDESDRLCQLALHRSELVKVCLMLGDMDGAYRNLVEAEKHIPVDKPQRIYVHVSKTLYNLRIGKVEAAVKALECARLAITNGFNAHHKLDLDGLQVEILMAQGRLVEARALMKEVITEAAKERKHGLMRQMQALWRQTS